MFKDGLITDYPKQAGSDTVASNTLHVHDVFDPSHFSENAALVIPLLEQYLADDAIRGLQLMHPAALLARAKALMTQEHHTIQALDQERLKAILQLYIQTGIQVHSTGVMGRQFSGVVPLAGVLDMVSSVVNQPSSFYEAGQLPNVAEHIMAEELNQFIGYDPDQFTMITTSGGSLANLTAILAARNAHYPHAWTDGFTTHNGLKPAIAVSEEAHYSISRAIGILGIGEKQIVRLPVNHAGQIVLEKVQPILNDARNKGLHVFCMVASAGTTAVGAVDPIDQLADIAAANNLWLHIDGAHGASLLVSDKLRYKLKGIHKADSITWDAHKMLFVPSPCSLLFYKNKAKSYGAFQQVASYVFDKEPTVYSRFESAEKNFECTKRPMIMNLWVLWALHGRALFAGKIEYLCRIASQAYAVLESEADFETLHFPECNIVCFRYTPQHIPYKHVADFQVKIRNHVSDEGRFFISKVDIKGEPALRVVFMNHDITMAHFQLLLQTIRQAGQHIIHTHQQNKQ